MNRKFLKSRLAHKQVDWSWLLTPLRYGYTEFDFIDAVYNTLTYGEAIPDIALSNFVLANEVVAVTFEYKESGTTWVDYQDEWRSWMSFWSSSLRQSHSKKRELIVTRRSHPSCRLFQKAWAYRDTTIHADGWVTYASGEWEEIRNKILWLCERLLQVRPDK